MEKCYKFYLFLRQTEGSLYIENAQSQILLSFCYILQSLHFVTCFVCKREVKLDNFQKFLIIDSAENRQLQPLRHFQRHCNSFTAGPKSYNPRPRRGIGGLIDSINETFETQESVLSGWQR